jgi:hypothetical protein
MVSFGILTGYAVLLNNGRTHVELERTFHRMLRQSGLMSLVNNPVRDDTLGSKCAEGKTPTYCTLSIDTRQRVSHFSAVSLPA